MQIELDPLSIFLGKLDALRYPSSIISVYDQGRKEYSYSKELIDEILQLRLELMKKYSKKEES